MIKDIICKKKKKFIGSSIKYPVLTTIDKSVFCWGPLSRDDDKIYHIPKGQIFYYLENI